MKVAYILHRFPYITETFVAQEIYSLKEQGIDVEIFSLLAPKHIVIHEKAKALLPCTHYSPWLSWSILWAQIYFWKRSPRRYLGALAKTLWQSYREPKVLLMALALFPKSVYIAQQIESLAIDHIHVHFIWLGALAAGVARELLGINYSVYPHAFDLFERNPGDVKAVLENAPAIVTISNYNRDFIVKLCPQLRRQDIEIVHCGVDTGYFQAASRQTPRDPLQILSVGQLVEKKGHEYLIDACAQLAQRNIRFQCQIAGAGPRFGALQARIAEHNLQDRVTLLGALRQDQLVGLYQDADIFTLACVRAANGDQDGIPVSLMEAMACELPVISTRVAGIPELIQPGKTGLVVDARDASGLATALEQLILDRDTRYQLGKAARQKIVNEFESQQNVAKLASILQRISKQGQEDRLKPLLVLQLPNSANSLCRNRKVDYED